MSAHPILDLVQDHDVKQAKGFRAAAERITGASLEAAYQQEVAAAPKRSEQGLGHLDVRTGRRAKARQHGKDERHLAEAIARAAKAGNLTPPNRPLELPTGESITIVDHNVPIRTAAPDPARGDADPNAGIEDVPLLAVLGEDRPAVLVLKFIDTDSNRSGANDTPLRLLLQGVAHAAAYDANRIALREEIAKATGKTTGDEAPAIIVAASPRYWELCRKREAQKGAAWIRELERIARESAEAIGCEIFFVSLATQGQPGWDYDEEGAVLSGPVVLAKAWEGSAGKLKAKPKSSKKSEPAASLVEADPDRPARRYSIRDTYEVADLIQHPKLGDGVVQELTGRDKILVLFAGEKKLLVHGRV
ncbi:MAG: hypothetical protein IPK00_19130 [Deltaproteobacteria bacterium]|nr:hypothetical protein [Deltaproteobacteria bacterium]